MRDKTVERIHQDYDCVAEEYARRVFHELDDKPLDRELPARFAGGMDGRVLIARKIRDFPARAAGIHVLYPL